MIEQLEAARDTKLKEYNTVLYASSRFTKDHPELKRLYKEYMESVFVVAKAKAALRTDLE
jgi:hypothetical protein